MRYLPFLIVALFSILQVADSVAANCMPQITVYDVINQTTYASYPFGSTLSVNAQIDLSVMNNSKFNIMADFCDDTIQSAKFVVTDFDTNAFIHTSIDNSLPFAQGGNTPPAFLKKQGNYFINIYGYGKKNARKAPISLVTLILQILPRIRVSGITFVDANTGKDIRSEPISPVYMSSIYLDLNKLPAHANLTIRVNQTVGTVKSVDFKLIGTDLSANRSNYSYPDNQASFALGGKSPNGKFNPVSALSHPGTLRLFVTAYSGSQKQGDSGSNFFDILLHGFRFDGPFTLVDAATNLDDSSFVVHNSDYWFPTIDLSQYPSNKTFTIRPTTLGSGGTVSYQLSRYQNVDLSIPSYDHLVPAFRSVQNKAPYSLSGVHNSVPALQRSGLYLLEATAFDGPDQRYISDFYSIVFAVLPRFKVYKLTLVDASSGKDVLVFFPGQPVSIYLTDYIVGSSFTIRADATGVRSVAFELSRLVNETYVNVTTMVDNSVPLTLDGMSSAGKYYAVPSLLMAGKYRLQVTAFAKPNKQGEAGFPSVFDFEIHPRLAITSLNLVDAANRRVLDTDISEIDLSFFGVDETFSITASTSGIVGSIDYVLHRYDAAQTETLLLHQVVNNFPFALRGAFHGGYMPVQVLQVPGHYRLSATPYSLSNLGGVKGPTLEQDIVILPHISIYGFSWIDVATGTSTGMFSETMLYLNQYPSGTTFDIQALASGGPGSVEFNLLRWNDSKKNYSLLLSKVDNLLPFSLGNSLTGNFTSVPSLQVQGRYLLQMTPYSLTNKAGTKGPTIEFELRVLPFLGSCTTYCGDSYVSSSNPFLSCSCNNTCVVSGTCCIDYCDRCTSLSPSVCN